MGEERLGFFGKSKNKIIKELNEKYKNNWDLKWKWGNQYIDNYFSIQLYEDAYYEYLKENLNILKKLIATAEDVYDNAISNTKSGLDYSIQETNSTHLQDIAIRRSVLRLGLEFKGDELIQVRGRNSKGYYLSPGIVPFHLPEKIEKPSLKGWWKENSIEDFYQSNKYLIFPD